MFYPKIKVPTSLFSIIVESKDAFLIKSIFGRSSNGNNDVVPVFLFVHIYTCISKVSVRKYLTSTFL